MDDPRWLRLVTIGLVVAAIAVGYFLIAGKFSANKSTKIQTQTVQQTPQPTSLPTVLGQDTKSSSNTQPDSAYNRIVQRTQGNVQNLPKTGFPVGLLGVFSLSAIIVGFGLSKFPH